MKDEEESSSQIEYKQLLFSLIGNKIYLFTMMSICCLLFIITGIQFWITDYMIEILKVDKSKVYVTFAIVCITAPTLGVIFGGYLIEKLGGYTDRRTLEACYKISIIAAVCGFPLPLINHYIIFVILMWLLLFFGGSIVPGLTGIMLSSIPSNYKETANSVTHFCYNLMGYLPAPFLYGLITKFTGGSESKFGLAFLMLVSILGVYMLHLAKLNQKNIDENGSYDNSYNKFNDKERIRKDNIINSNQFSGRKQSMIEQVEAISALYGRYSTFKKENDQNNIPNVTM